MTGLPYSLTDSRIASLTHQLRSGDDGTGGSRLLVIGSFCFTLLSSAGSLIAYGMVPDQLRIHWTLGMGPYYGPEFAPTGALLALFPVFVLTVGVGAHWANTELQGTDTRDVVRSCLALGTLGYVGYNEWQMSRHPNCDCETSLSPVVRRSLLGMGALAVVALIVSPWLIAPSPSAATQQAQAAIAGSESAPRSQASSTPASFQQVVLDVEGMTCRACPKTVSTALEDVEGVYSVDATYKPPEAVVRFDPEEVAVEDLTSATERAGFPSRQQSSP